MGRKGGGSSGGGPLGRARSSSLGCHPPADQKQRRLRSSSHADDCDGGKCLEAASKLFDLASIDIDGGGLRGGGGNFLHRMARHRDDYELEGLTLADRLIRGASEVDRRSADGSTGIEGGGSKQQHGRRPRSASFHKSTKHPKQTRRHLHRHIHSMMLRRDAESGYTPLHAALYHGRTRLALLLLRRAAEASAEDDGAGRKRAHPLALLDGSQVTSAPATASLGKGGGGGASADQQQQKRSLVSELVGAWDKEGLTPLEALCRSLSSDLGQCRRSLEVRTRRLDDGRRKLVRGDSRIAEEEERRHRRRTGRARSTSVAREDDEDEDRLDEDNEDFDDDSSEDRGGGRNEFQALYRTGADDMQTAQGVALHELGHIPSFSRDYGCEVLTFGRSDHCALGVPHFATRRDQTKSSAVAAGRNTAGEDASRGQVIESVRPRRVEAFALGEMGRNFDISTEEGHEGKGSSCGNEGDGCGPAVAVAAAAHHTLVVTRKGHLLSFGLGKGGRLGTGDESNRPVPTRVFGPLARRKVVCAAAAVNHSLCVTEDGVVYAFGSNRFGQLGVSASPTGSAGATKASTASSSRQRTARSRTDDRCLPRRIDGLRSAFVVSVAAGDRHSVALTRRGEVYAWGDNRAGQLGTILLGDGPRLAAAASSGGGNSGSCYQPRRVDALWSASPRRVAVEITASEQATLVLTLPPLADGSKKAATLPVNSVYGWGHGRHTPTRVSFPAPTADSHQERQFQRCVNPVAIASAKYHNAAVTADGYVFTWGMHSDPLGTSSSNSKVSEWSDSEGGLSSRGGWDAPSETQASKAAKKSTSPNGALALASPQLVTGMLPENGGGFAVSVSASESRTAVVTDAGHLYTWGSAYGNEVLGHEGTRYQPTPRRVPGVHRAVAVATAREHTALLIGTSFPALSPLISTPLAETLVKVEKKVNAGNSVADQVTASSCFDAPEEHKVVRNVQGETGVTLQDLTTSAVARHVDLFNAVPVLIMAERIGCLSLSKYCEKFIKANLDGVLASSKKMDLEAYLDESLAMGGRGRNEVDCLRDEHLHPFLFQLANVYTGTTDWLDSCLLVLSTLPPALISRRKTEALHREDGVLANRNSASPRRDRATSFSELGCSEKCHALTRNIEAIKPDAIKEQIEAIAKEVRNAKKKLTQISELEKVVDMEGDEEKDISQQQLEKLARRPVLEADLEKLQPALEALENRLRSLKLEEEKFILLDSAADSHENVKVGTKPPEYKLPGNRSISVERKSAEKVEVRYRCETCKVTCPDEHSYELHINGKRHRNKQCQFEEEEKKNAVAITEERKRQQILLSGQSPVSARASVRSAAAENETWDIQPRYNLPCPPAPAFSTATLSLPSTPVSQGKPSPSWSATPHVAPEVEQKAAVNDFKKILEEQSAVSKQTKPSGRKARQPKSSWTSPVPWAGATAGRSSCARVATNDINQETSSSSAKISLSAFLEKPTPAKGKQKQDSKGGAWGQKPAVAPRPGAALSKTSTAKSAKKSLDEIQREELKFKEKADQACSMQGTMWYVAQREKANSLGAIQKQQEEQHQMQLVIQEQKRIEEQIARDLRNEKAAQKKARDKKHQQKRRSRKPVSKKSVDKTNAQGDQGKPQRSRHRSQPKSGASTS